MISGFLILLLLTTSASAEAPDSLDELVGQIAGEADHGRLAFTERRESELLEEPLTVRGQLWRDERGRLVRETEAPRRETQILGERVLTIRRPGQQDRNFSLGRAPELAVLRQALSALLDGDADALREHFRIQLERDGQAWQLRLDPRDPSLAESVSALELTGCCSNIERMVLELADGKRIVTDIQPPS